MLASFNQSSHSVSQMVALSHLKADLLQTLATAEEGQWMRKIIHENGEYVQNKELKDSVWDKERDLGYLLNYENKQDCYNLCFDMECNSIMFWYYKDGNPWGVSHDCEVAKFSENLSQEDFIPLTEEHKDYYKVKGTRGFFEPAHWQ